MTTVKQNHRILLELKIKDNETCILHCTVSCRSLHVYSSLNGLAPSLYDIPSYVKVYIQFFWCIFSNTISYYSSGSISLFLLKELENIIRVSGGAFYNFIRRFYISNTFCFV